MPDAENIGANELPKLAPECRVAKRRLVLLSEIIAPYRIPVFNALAEAPGIDLHVIFLAETDAVLRQWQIYKNEIRFQYEVLPSWRVRAGRKNLLLNRKLLSRLKAIAPQVILCGGYNYAASWQALSWARRNHADFVLWCESNRHDTRSGNAVVESLKRNFTKRCTRFVVPGTASLEYLVSLGAASGKILVAPNAVDNDTYYRNAHEIRGRQAEFREQLSLPERFLLFVGRLVPEKGVFDLLEAYSKLDTALRSKVGLVFTGDGVARDKLKAAARGVQPGRVCFPGFAQREELAALYGLADALVLPTHSDPWGLVVNEAMACGLPVIVTDVAGCSADLVQDGWNGYIVPPRNPGRLTDVLDSFLRDDERMKRMGMRSLEKIREFSPEACAKGLAAAALACQGEKE